MILFAGRLRDNADGSIREEKLDDASDDEARHEAADVRPVGNAIAEVDEHVRHALEQPAESAEVHQFVASRQTSHRTDRAEHARELHHEPANQEPVGLGVDVSRSRQDVKARDGGVMPHQQVSAEHARDGARSTEGGHHAHRVAAPVGQSREHAADQVEGQVVALAEPVFHALAEDKEEDHVAEDVTQAPVKEHGGEDGQGGHEHCARIASSKSCRDLTGHHEPRAKKLVLVARENHGDFEDESHHVCQDEPLSDSCRARATQVVLERKHIVLLGTS